MSADETIAAMKIATTLTAGLFHEGGIAGTGATKPYPAHHLGGIVGAGTTERRLPAILFSQAPKLHAGLEPDEFPAILKRGEQSTV